MCFLVCKAAAHLTFYVYIKDQTGTYFYERQNKREESTKVWVSSVDHDLDQTEANKLGSNT